MLYSIIGHILYSKQNDGLLTYDYFDDLVYILFCLMLRKILWAWTLGSSLAHSISTLVMIFQLTDLNSTVNKELQFKV